MIVILAFWGTRAPDSYILELHEATTRHSDSDYSVNVNVSNGDGEYIV